MEKLLRCAIYIRVSTWEQATRGKSLTAQKEYLEGYAESHGMTVIGVYADEGQTARKELKKRKAIHSLLADVKADKIDVILFWRMDRWFRNVSDFYKVQGILDAHGTRWVDVGEPNINMETRDGRLSLNLALAIGQNEVDTTSERIKFTVDNTIKNGGMVWGEVNLPLGYTIAVVDGKKHMVKDEKTAPIVEEFFSYFLKHQKKRQTVIHIQDTFGIPFSYSMLKTMLSSEFYIGKYRENRSYCPAYLTLEQWEQVQTISKRNIKNTPSGRVYLFTGLMHCPVCGQKLAGTGCQSIINRKTGEKRTYCYYRCNRAIIDHICTYTHKVSQNLLEEYLLQNIKSEYEKYRQSYLISQKKKIKKTKNPERLKEELERLNILFQKGRVSYDYYEKEYSRLEREISEASIIEFQSSKADPETLRQILDGDFRRVYEALSPENRQAYWRGIIKEIVLTEDHQIDHVIFL